MAVSAETRYSRIDRFLHRLAFAGVGLQKSVADLEDRLYKRRFAEIAIDKPVFVTSLPRAGTTLLLEVISALPQFASHTYREMPFLLCPLMWHDVSGRFRRVGDFQERAHGDGMMVGYDSVEGFEEILWRAFWSKKYAPDRILPWHASDAGGNDEFRHFLANHIRKLIALRANGSGQPTRYISKNNVNIARLQLLPKLFADAIILVPFRHPVDQAASMLRQHRNFSTLHAGDTFARRYMATTGHMDFGANLRPIDFGGWLDRDRPRDPNTLDFWLAYWCAAFSCVLAIQPKDTVHLVSYDRCCANAPESLQRIGKAIALTDTDLLRNQASRFRVRPAHDCENPGYDRGRIDRALAIHDELLRRAIV